MAANEPLSHRDLLEWRERWCESLPERAIAAFDRLVPSLPVEEPQGTFACPECGIDTPHHHDIDAVNRKRVIERVVRPAFEKRYMQLAEYRTDLRVSGYGLDLGEHGFNRRFGNGEYAAPLIESLWRLWQSAWEQNPSVAEPEAGTLKDFADAVEKLAFEMPPPNPYTPRFVQLVAVARALSHEQSTAASSDEHKEK